jgi:Family of unknown function (DUF6508)
MAPRPVGSERPRWPGREEIRALLRHLPALQQPAERLCRVHTALERTGPDGRALTMPWVEYGPEVTAFFSDVNRLGFVHVFDWPSWRERDELDADPRKLAAADLTDIVKLLTAHTRAERFVDGHWYGLLRSGRLVAVLRRLAAIDALLDTDPAADLLIEDREGLARC